MAELVGMARWISTACWGTKKGPFCWRGAEAGARQGERCWERKEMCCYVGIPTDVSSICSERYLPVNFQILLTLFSNILSDKALGYPEYSERACNPERMSWQWRLKLSCPWSCIEGIWVYWRYKTSFSMAQDQCEWTASCCDCFTPGENSYGSHLIRVPEPVWTIWRRENCCTHSRN